MADDPLALLQHRNPVRPWSTISGAAPSGGAVNVEPWWITAAQCRFGALRRWAFEIAIAPTYALTVS